MWREVAINCNYKVMSSYFHETSSGLAAAKIYSNGLNGWVWRELLQWLELDVVPLPEVAVRANAGTGATRESGDDSRARIRSQLREQLAQTYASMENQYGLAWNVD